MPCPSRSADRAWQMEFEVTTAFPTFIGRVRVPDADAMNQDLRALILAEEASYSSLGRSNVGGWHSRPDFLNRPQPEVAALTTWLTWAVRRMVEATAAGGFKGTLSVAAWATICRTGAYHAPHSHPTVRGPASTMSMRARVTRPSTEWCAGVSRSARRRRERHGARRSLRGTFCVPLNLAARGLSELALHWVHPYAGHTPARRLVQRDSPRHRSQHCRRHRSPTLSRRSREAHEARGEGGCGRAAGYRSLLLQSDDVHAAVVRRASPFF